MQDFTLYTRKLQLQQDLSEAEIAEAIQRIFTSKVPDSDIVDFLIALHQKGESAAELAGAARAMRQAMLNLHSVRRPVLDTCGTGGDGSKTFNISTAAAIALAASGCVVAKHGNRKVTSSSGSADVLAVLGINLEASPAVVERCLNELGLCFCFAPHFHPAMRSVANARKSLTHPTIFNRLGPLCNPAHADHQVLGVGDSTMQDRLATTLQLLGTRRSLVVRGDDGVDELSISTETRVLEVTSEEINEHRWSPKTFGMNYADRLSLFADDPHSSARCIRDVLHGTPGPCRDVVVMNAAAGLWLTQPEADLAECAEQVAQSIDSGRAAELLGKLAATTSLPSTQ